MSYLGTKEIKGNVIHVISFVYLEDFGLTFGDFIITRLI